MPITKNYNDSFTVVGDADAVLALAMQALQTAGFKKVQSDSSLRLVTGDWKPMIGKLWGSIEVGVEQEGPSVIVQLRSKAAVDNFATLAKSPGARIFGKFAEAFNPLFVNTAVAMSQHASPAPEPVAPKEVADLVPLQGDIPAAMVQIKSLFDKGILNDEEYAAKKAELLARI